MHAKGVVLAGWGGPRWSGWAGLVTQMATSRTWVSNE